MSKKRVEAKDVIDQIVKIVDLYKIKSLTKGNYFGIMALTIKDGDLIDYSYSEKKLTKKVI